MSERGANTKYCVLINYLMYITCKEECESLHYKSRESGVELNIKYGSFPISAIRGGVVFSFFSGRLTQP
jgi:hypothetical protein